MAQGQLRYPLWQEIEVGTDLNTSACFDFSDYAGGAICAGTVTGGAAEIWAAGNEAGPYYQVKDADGVNVAANVVSDSCVTLPVEIFSCHFVKLVAGQAETYYVMGKS